MSRNRDDQVDDQLWRDNDTTRPSTSAARWPEPLNDDNLDDAANNDR